jgi:hypothetical protein
VLASHDIKQRLCSSYASGLATAEKLLSGRVLDDEEMELELGDENLDFVDEEVRQLQAIIDVLSPHPTDPKLDAVLYYLLERPDPWLPKGCIIFSQYFDTAKWVGEALTQRIPGEPIAAYAGAGKSGMYISGEWKSVEREQIKRAVKERTIRLVVATDAACEGLNLQTLGKEFAYGLYSKVTWPLYRTIGAEPDVQDNGTHVNVNESIDKSVFDRWRSDPSYRPRSLVEWADRKHVDPTRITGSVRADDPKTSAPD